MTCPLKGQFAISTLMHHMANQCTKFSSFSSSRHILGETKNLNGSCDVTMPHLGVTCHLFVET